MRENNKTGLISFIWLLLLTAATVPLLMSFLGSLHPMLDSVAHFRRHMAVVLIIATIPLFFTSFKRFGLAIIAFSLFCVLSTYQTQDLKPTSTSGNQHFKLIQTNLRYDNPNTQKLIDLLNSEKPDFVTYQEASSHWQRALSEFAQTNNYYTYKCERAQISMIGATGFLSRYPFISTMPKEVCPHDAGIATAMVNIGAKTPLKLSSIHLFWPWPYRQNSQINTLPLTKEPLQLIGGDFNATSWSYAVKHIEEKTATHHVNGIASSWLSYSFPDWTRPILGLPIDQILLSDDFKLHKVEQLPSIGSDHLPMKVEFSL